MTHEYNESRFEGMASPELVHELKTLSRSMIKMSNSVTTLVESDIRRQEKESRQEEINNRLMIGLSDVTKEVEKIKLSRAEEKQGREALTKWWPVLAIGGAALVYQVTRSGLIP